MKHHDTGDDMQLLSVKSAAQAIQTSQHTIYRAIQKGELRAFDVNTGNGERPRIRVDVADLRAWLETRVTQPRTDTEKAAS